MIRIKEMLQGLHPISLNLNWVQGIQLDRTLLLHQLIEQVEIQDVEQCSNLYKEMGLQPVSLQSVWHATPLSSVYTNWKYLRSV